MALPVITSDLPICGYFDVQRFPQFTPADSANWYLVPNEEGKKKVAMYPSMGREHINFFGRNQLQFVAEPRGLFKTSDFWYVVVQNRIYRIDGYFNTIQIDNGQISTLTGDMFFSYLVAGAITFACFVDGQHIYIYREDTNSFSVVTDSHAPSSPAYIATFGNRLVVSQTNSSQFNLSTVNLDGGSFNPALCFTIGGLGGVAVFAQEDDVITQMAVMHNILYIFTAYTTGVWQNSPSIFSGVSGGPTTSFPFTKNKSYSFEFGLTDPASLSVDYNMMGWLARNRGGLVQFMVSSGGVPERISTRAVDVLLQRNAVFEASQPFVLPKVSGFFYSYENTIFYRASLGLYNNNGDLDITEDSFCLDFNFDAMKWNRCIEANGERNRANKHIYFNGRHFITVLGESTVYEMSGAFYVNELRNTAESDPQADDAYTQFPFRYERITPIIHEEDYSEFQTDYVEIDFVFGDQDFIYSLDGFQNTQYIVSEGSTPTNPIYLIQEGTDSDPIYIVGEQGNYPQLSDQTYNTLFKPNITLYWSDDGGVTFHSADNREFSQLGMYIWKMRWYQLGCSRNRVYKLVCVSPAPIVVLGGVQMKKRVSGGAY